MLKLVVVSILLFSSFAYSEFLVGQGKLNGTISILCEGQQTAFVSGPSGKTAQLLLDSFHQAEFYPAEDGPYTVQCGGEAKTVQAKIPVGAPEAGGASSLDERLLAAIASLLLSLLFAVLIVGWQATRGRMEFSKTVENNRARLRVRAAKKLGKVTVSDPVSMGHHGKNLDFSIPVLEAGSEWGWEYVIENGERALPASMHAEVGGKMMEFLSELFIGGERVKGKEGRGTRVAGKGGSSVEGKEPADYPSVWQGKRVPRRKIPKAGK